LSKGSDLGTSVRHGPFSPTILEKARALANEYRILLAPVEGGGFAGHCVEVPTVWAKGRTADECVEATLRRASMVVAYLLEQGRPVPRAAKKRTEQVNIRLSGEEKVLLKAAAQDEGLNSLSDFVRRLALEGVRHRS